MTRRLTLGVMLTVFLLGAAMTAAFEGLWPLFTLVLAAQLCWFAFIFFEYPKGLRP
jgi:hypothetical protein